MRPLGLAVVLLLGAGCFGGSGSASAPPHGFRRCTHAELAKKAFRSTCAYQTADGAWKVVQVSGVSPVIPIKVDWRVTYEVGFPKSDRSALPGCPDGARCRVLRDPHLASGTGVHPWMEVAVRHVFCAASGRPTSESCQAIARLRAILAKPVHVACGCPFAGTIRGVAVTRIDGHRVVVPLDVCTYCGRSTKQTDADLALLQPQT